MLTDAEAAVLSLLVEEPRHGYEIERVIEERGMRQWTEIGFSSIYYVLARLQKTGLVSAAAPTGEGRGPARKAYAPTLAGFEALARATVDTLSTLRSPNPFMLGLANISTLPDDVALDALRARAAAIAERLREVRDRRDESEAAPHVGDLFEYGVRILEAEAAWLDETIARREHSNGRLGKM